ncbi:MAG: alpha/beta hydrolase [Oleiphilaceae bacterium]|nr:alpha/beta hydrolase [Oleiphilaceae bacterium]
MTSIPARLVKWYARRLIRLDPSSPTELVRHLRRRLDHPPMPVMLPKGVHQQSFRTESVSGDWLSVKDPGRAVLYLHGGGYVSGVTKTYLNLCGKLANALHADVYLPNYRLAPEHPFPAAVEDAMASYRLLLTRFGPGSITIMGDSAGGGLALGTLLAIRETQLPMPRCAVAYSPYADMTQEQPSREANQDTDSFFMASTFQMIRTLYTPSDESRRHPQASPVFGDFDGFPPLLLTVDEGECLRDDAYCVADRAREAGVPVETISRTGMMHVWPIFYPLLSEAREDVAATVRFIRKAGEKRVPEASVQSG